MIRWCLSAAGWLAAAFLLSRLGPIGRVPWFDAVLYLAGFAGMFLMMRSWPRQWSFRTSVVAILFLALAGRGFFWQFPVNNDVYRYIWEGYLQLQGFNPYRLPPDSPVLSHLATGALQDIWPPINHKDLTAAYPPLTLLLFRILAALAPTPLVFKGGILCFDLVLTIALAGMLKSQRLPAQRLLLYAANPLVLVFVAGEAHLDVIQAALLMLGIALLQRQRQRAGFLLLGMAVMSKYLAVAVFPFVMTLNNRRAWPFALLPLAAFLPFSDAGADLFNSLLHFGSRMHYNDGLPVLIRFLWGANALWVSMLFLLAGLTIIYLTVPNRLRSIYLAIGTLLLLLPTLHPWYLLLIIPFMVFFPSRPWLFLCAAMVLTFPVLAIELRSGVFQEIHGLKPLIYLPFAALLLHALWRPDEDWTCQAYPAAGSVSVVIPALNEEAGIKAAIVSARRHSEVVEIVVADGGSSDRTVEFARQARARTIDAPRGRGHQIRAGVDHTRGDVILVLHADSRLRAGAVARMLARLSDYTHAPGGAFAMTFEVQKKRTRWIARLNHWRARWTGISFGDQGQFFHRAALDDLGGFPACLLMEDVEFALRMKTIGRPLYVPAGIRVSARRWGREGFGGNLMTVIGLFVRYLVLRRFGADLGENRYFYRRYYRPHQTNGD